MKKIFTLITMMLLATMSSMATTYTVAGSEYIVNNKANWNPSEEANDMTSEDGNIYTLTVSGLNLEAGDYEWKIVEDHSWSVSYPSGTANETLNIPENGKYDITYTLNLSEGSYGAVATKTGEYVPTGEHHYTVAGTPASMFGTEWDPTNTANEMEKQADGTYKIVYTNVVLPSGPSSVKFKVTVDYSWGKAYPSSDYALAIPEDGAYDVTITYNPNDNSVNATAEKAGEAVIEKDYFVAGQEALMGVDWNPSAPENQMTENEDGTYTLSFKATLTAGENYQFKVVTNGDWDQPSYGADTESGNFEFTVDEDGDYDITITFKPATEEITITLEKDTTGIGTIQSSKFNAQSNIYNLRGQRVNASTRGILIVNGKKVVVK